MNKLPDLLGGDSAKEEPEVTNDGPYSQQKGRSQGEETSSATAEETNDIMIEITAKAGVTNEVSTPREEDNPWEAFDGRRVTGNGEYSANPTSNFESKKKFSIPLEEDTPWVAFG